MSKMLLLTVMLGLMATAQCRSMAANEKPGICPFAALSMFCREIFEPNCDTDDDVSWNLASIELTLIPKYFVILFNSLAAIDMRRQIVKKSTSFSFLLPPLRIAPQCYGTEKCCAVGTANCGKRECVADLLEVKIVSGSCPPDVQFDEPGYRPVICDVFQCDVDAHCNGKAVGWFGFLFRLQRTVCQLLGQSKHGSE